MLAALESRRTYVRRSPVLMLLKVPSSGGSVDSQFDSGGTFGVCDHASGNVWPFWFSPGGA